MQRRRSPVPAPFDRAAADVEEEDEAEAEAQVLSVSDQRTLYLVNMFVANAAQFLNSFAAVCQDKLSLVHRKIVRLDASLALLESKLSAVREEPSGMAEAGHRPNDNAIMSKDKSVVPDEPSDVACSSSESLRLVFSQEQCRIFVRFPFWVLFCCYNKRFLKKSKYSFFTDGHGLRNNTTVNLGVRCIDGIV